MTFLKSIKKNSILIAAMYGVMGYFLILQKEKSLDIVLTVLAAGLAAAGFFSIVRYFLLKIDERFKRNDFIIGIVLIAAGAVIYLVKNNISDMTDNIFGVMMIVNGLFCIQDALDAKYVGMSSVGVYILLMLIEIGIGAIIILKPFEIDNSKYILIGGGMLLCAVENILSNIFLAIYRTGYEVKLRKKEKEEERLRKAEEEARNKASEPEPEVEIEEPKLSFEVPEVDNTEDDPEEEKPLE
ncbi:MAG: DUF308 domain-containing protein [Erysipelotrichaceae bacterium]|nr:DUF308 domain-containing protein [Erysipelotrichaceae bacterium]